MELLELDNRMNHFIQEYFKEPAKFEGSLRVLSNLCYVLGVEPKIELKKTQDARIEELEAALKQCANVFLNYYELHMAKTPPDEEKANRNFEMFRMCCDVLATPENTQCSTKSSEESTTANG